MAIFKDQFRYDMVGVFYCTSNDVKPINVKDGAMLLETDTGRIFQFDAATGRWIPN